MAARTLHDAARPALSPSTGLHNGCTNGCTNLPERAGRGPAADPQAAGLTSQREVPLCSRAEVLGGCTTAQRS